MQFPQLLCLATNPDLLEIRRRVLLTRYRVTAVDRLDAMEALPGGSEFDVLVLCHSLSAEDCSKAVRFAREFWPKIKVLAISAPGESQGQGELDAVVSGLAGPYAMFDAVEQLLPSATPTQA